MSLVEAVAPVRQSAPPALAKVLHVVNGEHYAGAERVQDLLALALPEHGFEVGFVVLKAGRFKKLRQAQQTPLFELPMRSRFDLPTVTRLAALIRDEGYALVHTHTPRTAFIGRLAAARAGVPVMHHLHSPTSRDTTHGLRNWVNATAERFSLSGVDAVVAVSQSLARYARRNGVAPEKTFVVPNGVPCHLTVRPRRRPSGCWTLAAAALFRPRKGTEALLQALAILKSAGMPVRLHAVGAFESGEYEQHVKSLADKLGVEDIVDWRGFCADVNAELDVADLFVLPSLFGEGMPMVVLEAMAAGLPVIGTHVEGVPEVVRDGLEGLIVAPGDAHALAAAVERFVTGQVDWPTLAANARRRQSEGFSQQTMAAGLADVYRRVLVGG